jgi:hypothetical protein
VSRIVTVGDLSRDSTTNSGTGLVALFNVILSIETGERASSRDRNQPLDPRYQVSSTVAWWFGLPHHPQRTRSLHLNREMCWTKRLQKVPGVKDFAGSEHASPFRSHARDALGGFDHQGRSKGVDVAPPRHYPTFFASGARHYFNQESLR